MGSWSISAHHPSVTKGLRTPFINDDDMKLATYNVNGINGRLPVLLRWLEQSEPDVVCLQELKAPQEKFPARDRESGLRRNLAWAEELEWRCHIGSGTQTGRDPARIARRSRR